MIIECPCKKKKFNIDINLIPAEGRNLQCGSCDRVWFYKKQDTFPEPIPVKEDANVEKNENNNQVIDNKTDNQEKKQSLKFQDKEELKSLEIKKPKSIPEETKKNQSSKFFSYLIVFIISLGALVVILDTLKTPLINVFPGLEVLLFNLYETLKDIKLFIIDLS